ncbi:MAG: HD-GYP domain-containing protein [Armatimonadota bacterium]|nr:HD-GYP domain-containing protein [Armatimonadota bacterium]MDR7468154.1 HD-GYP domain-containing protein [Armatimonadota bacterium]MDR7495148.1 HD-GYP domain-containing protein [Armatimonadota bacterium]MDR7499282.1 HD-GYP domain-containing protein [Armatimonadota bacterium]MDR7505106.1 HD-GYP domain-containing protein [Armatimonadota bacterium]
MRLSRAAWLYMGATMAAGIGLVLFLRGWIPTVPSGPTFWVLLAGSLLLIPVSGYCLICLGKNVAVNMGSAVMMALLLLLPPGFAALTAAAGVALLYTLQRWEPELIAFNAAQTALTVGLAGALYWRLSPGPLATGFSLPQVAAVLTSVAAFYVVNSLVVTGAAVLLQRTRFPAYWRATFGRALVPYLSTLLLGVVAAVIFIHAPYFTPVLALPVAAVYRALRSERIVLRQTKETVELLADTIDRRDPYTFAHSQRVAALARRLADRLGLDPETCEAIARAARVHDVGKLGIPDALLRKSGSLSRREIEQVRRHAAIGAEIVGSLPEYREGKEFILYHHERYDGGGYFGLSGERIPLGARIIAVADALDAMTSDRPYRTALGEAQALAELERGRGTQFDPQVVRAVRELLTTERQSLREILADASAALPDTGKAAAHS